MRDTDLSIRRGNLSDVELITRLSSETFYESFAAQNTKEDMDIYISGKFNSQVIESELKDKHTVFFIAFIGNEAVGYTKLRENKIPAGLESGKAVEIERIYVYRKFQHQKIGAALMKKDLDYALEKGFDTIWLGVWEHNLGSIKFYERWGFEIFGQHIFRLGNDDQNDLLMRKKIKLT